MNVNSNFARPTSCNILTTRHHAESDDTFLNDLWRHPSQPAPPFWRSFSRICKPFHFVLDKILAVANHKLCNNLQASLIPGMLSDLHFVSIGIKISSTDILEQIQKDMSELSEKERKLRLDLVAWVNKDVKLRIEACEQRVKNLDNYTNYPPPTKNRPIWTPEPAVVTCLNVAQSWAEKTHLAKNIPTNILVPIVQLSAAQLDELSIGLNILKMYCNLRKVEISSAKQIDQRHRANGLVKLALIFIVATPFVRGYKLPCLAASLISLGGAIWQHLLLSETFYFHANCRFNISICATDLLHAVFTRKFAMRKAHFEGRPFREEDVVEAEELIHSEEVEETTEAELANRLRIIREELAQMQEAERRREDELQQAREIKESLERRLRELQEQTIGSNSCSEDPRS